MGTQLPLLPKGHTPQFSAPICCRKMAGWIKMPLGREVGLSPSDTVRWGLSSPSPKRGQSPFQFSAHVCCGQTDGSIKMPLGMEVGLGPGHIVLHGDPAHTPRKGAQPPPQFSADVCCGQTVAHLSYYWVLVFLFLCNFPNKIFLVISRCMQAVKLCSNTTWPQFLIGLPANTG